MNKLMLIGRLAADPEMAYGRSGTPYAKFTVVTNERYNGEDHPTFHRCTAFNKTAEVLCEHLGKGDGVYVEGRQEHDRSEDENGNVRYWANVNVQRFEFLPGRSGEGQGRNASERPMRASGKAAENYDHAKSAAGEPAGGDMDDDIPFAQFMSGMVV